MKKPKIISITIEHEKGISIIERQDLLEMEEAFNEIIEDYEDIILARFSNGLDH